MRIEITLETLISIHVLRVEDDSRQRNTPPQDRHFNPLPPCGGRPNREQLRQQLLLFQSTSSVWRTTPPPIWG